MIDCSAGIFSAILALGLACTPCARALDVVDIAAAQIGKPYMMGGNGPDSYDCSGLTKYAYSMVGISLPRHSSDQSSVGVPVAGGAFQRGDLLFFASTDAEKVQGIISHVGIYEGNNVIINANWYKGIVSRDDVTTSVWPRWFITARRIAATYTTVDFEQFSGSPSVYLGVQPPLTIGIATFSGGQLLSAASQLANDRSTVYGTAYFAPGFLPTITINFSQPVGNFSVLIANGWALTIDYTIQDDRGGIQTRTLGSLFDSSGAATLSLPSTGIRQVVISSGMSNWNFVIDNVQFTPM